MFVFRKRKGSSSTQVEAPGATDSSESAGEHAGPALPQSTAGASSRESEDCVQSRTKVPAATSYETSSQEKYPLTFALVFLAAASAAAISFAAHQDLFASGLISTLLVSLLGFVVVVAFLLPVLIKAGRDAKAHDLVLGALNSVESPLIIYDEQRLVSQFNNAAYEFMGANGVVLEKGVSFEQLLRDTIPEEITSPADRETIFRSKLQRMHDSIQTGKPFTHYNEKRERYYQMRFAGLESGHVVDLRSDITDQKNIEIELQVRAEELEKSRNDAHASNLAKSEFLANMSHEIRTPMNGVIGMTELLLESDLNEEQRMFASTVSKSSQALLTIINDILDFSKIEAGKLEIDYQPFDLRSAIEDVASLLLNKAHTKGIELVTNFAPDLPVYFVGDAGRIRQVLTNLIGNAIKFTETGYVLVEVKGNVASATATLEFSVTDTGIGIPVSDHSLVFSEFEQVDSASNRKFEGTGLGLAISRRLVRLMGGDINVVSAPSEGSVFSFSLQLAVDTGRNTQNMELAPTQLSGLRVLIVDDLPLNLEILSRRLISWDAKPILANSANEALTILQQEYVEGRNFDLAIVDFQMPQIDGFELCKRIRGNSNWAELPIILLSSVDQSTSSERIRHMGFQDALLKPVKADALVKSITRCMQAPVASVDSKKMKDGGEIESLTTDQSGIVPASAASDFRLLVVEDNEINQLVISSMLEPRGYEIELAGNGLIGVESFKLNRPDLVLMDISMPEMNGIEATGEIRRHEEQHQLPACPIIALTANAMRGDREKCLAAGMDDFMSKPIEMDELYTKLGEWLNKGGEDDRDKRQAA